MEASLNWYGARGDCANKGGRLAEIDNAEINNRLKMIAFGNVFVDTN